MRIRRLWLQAIAVDRSLPTHATAIAVHLDSYFNANSGEAWPKVSTICKGLGLAERTVQKVLAALEETGFLERELGSGRRTTRYRIASNFMENVAGVHSHAPQAAEGCTDMHPRGARTCTAEVHHDAPRTLKENTSKEHRHRLSSKAKSAKRPTTGQVFDFLDANVAGGEI